VTARTFVRRALAVVAFLGATVSIAACGSGSSGAAPAKPPMSGMTGMSGMDDMPGMSAAPTASPLAEAQPKGDGLSSGANGYSFTPASSTLPAGVPTTFDYQIAGPAGRAVTRYQPYQSQLMLFDVVRSDLTGYQHFDPAMRENGSWSVPLPALSPGSYRAYVTFATPDASAGKPLVYMLSQPFTVPGQATDTTPMVSAASAKLGTVTVTLAGHPKAGTATPLTVGFTDNGKPISYFQRYLDGYAHITAVHAGDLALAHLTPADRIPGRHDLSELTTTALFPTSGTWRLFVRFQTSGPIQTATFTINVG
jgi:hypothetical protein